MIDILMLDIFVIRLRRFIRRLHAGTRSSLHSLTQFVVALNLESTPLKLIKITVSQTRTGRLLMPSRINVFEEQARQTTCPQARQ